jgi:hypothetical protein
MDTSGLIRGFNHIDRKYYTYMPIAIQSILSTLNDDVKKQDDKDK